MRIKKEVEDIKDLLREYQRQNIQLTENQIDIYIKLISFTRKIGELENQLLLNESKNKITKRM